MPHGEKRQWGLMSGLRRYFWRQAEANDSVPFHQVSNEVSISFPSLLQHHPQVQRNHVHRTWSLCRVFLLWSVLSGDQEYMCSATCVAASIEEELPLKTLFRVFFFLFFCRQLQSAFRVENTWRFFSFSSSSTSPAGTGVLAVPPLQVATH